VSNYKEIAVWLKARLHEILEEELGTFVSTRGTVYPAVWIQGTLVPPDWKKNGLCITLYEKPEGNKQAVTGGSFNPGWWRLRMVQYDSTKSCSEAFDKIDGAFPKVNGSCTPETMETLEQCDILIWIPSFDRKSNKFIRQF